MEMNAWTNTINTSRTWHFDLSTAQRIKMEEISEYIKQNYASEDSKSKAYLAKLFGVSERTLLRLISKAFQRPLNKQVNEIRLSYSIVALMSTDKPVAEIAKSVGFEVPHYFSRAFKRRFGLSPTAIRT